MDDWDQIHKWNQREARKHLTATLKWAAKCAKENPPEASIVTINPNAEAVKGYGGHCSGQDAIARFQTLGVDPDDIEVTNG
jgi:hypothetical protein